MWMHGATEQGAEFLFGDSEMAVEIRSKDWSRTALGPIDTWPQSLRTTISLCLASNFPINIIWGPESVQIYNDGYRVLCGEGHPTFLGMAYSEAWASAWPAIGAPFEMAMAGETSFLENQRMFLNRNGYLEETFFTFSLSPIRDESGGIGGLFHPVTETTPSIIGERRTRAVRDLTAALSQAGTMMEVFDTAAKTLSQFDYDLPFVKLYDSRDDGTYALVASFGLSDGRAALDASDDRVWPVRALIETASTVEVQGLSGGWNGQVGPYDEPPDRAFLVPITLPGVARPRGIMIAGASARLPMTDDYRGFYDLIGAALSAAVGKVLALEQERLRVEAMAAIDHAKTAFFSNVSHEFRTPLTLLLGPIEEALADAAGLPDKQRERLELAHRNAQRLLRLVNSLLDFSRIEAGRSQAVFQSTDLAALTADLASNFRSATDRAGLSLEVTSNVLSRDVVVDRDMYEKIVLNLLSNAFKFTHVGGISVGLAEADDNAVLTVADTGVGIPKEEMPRVFERFHRIEGQKGRTFEGTGIGLALVEELVKLHGGAISVDSEVGRGTTFRVVLPFGEERLENRPPSPSSALASTAVGAEAFVAEALRWLPDNDFPRDNEATSSTVVLADDNADMRDYVRRLLMDSGYHVVTAANGADALRVIHDVGLPDLVVTDVMMPEIDGFGLLKAIRGDATLSAIPVIFLSARAGEEARVEGLTAGADDYIVKPFNARELKARVDAMMTLSSQRRAAAKKEQALHIQEAAERSRAALELGQARLEVALGAGRLGAWELHVHTGQVIRTALHDEIFGYDVPLAEWSYDMFLSHVVQEDRPHVEASFRSALESRNEWHFECRIERQDGMVRWIEATGEPAPEASGEVRVLVGVVADITERREHNEQQQAMVHELNHRVKNTLAIIQSIVMQTQRMAKDKDALATGIESRIIALSRSHELLTESSWVGASLRDIAERALAPMRSAFLHRIHITGPYIRLAPAAAVSLHMAFFELATNAVRYGALSTGTGSLSIMWRVDPAGASRMVEIEWSESGGPQVFTHERQGFGSRLVEKGLARELDGTVDLVFDPQGVQCRMRFPVSAKLKVGNVE
jgi:PAS domain S-box-containing protein